MQNEGIVEQDYEEKKMGIRQKEDERKMNSRIEFWRKNHACWMNSRLGLQRKKDGYLINSRIEFRSENHAC